MVRLCTPVRAGRRSRGRSLSDARRRRSAAPPAIGRTAPTRLPARRPRPPSAAPAGQSDQSVPRRSPRRHPAAPRSVRQPPPTPPASRPAEHTADPPMKQSPAPMPPRLTYLTRYRPPLTVFAHMFDIVKALRRSVERDECHDPAAPRQPLVATVLSRTRGSIRTPCGPCEQDLRLLVISSVGPARVCAGRQPGSTVEVPHHRQASSPKRRPRDR